MKVLDSGHLMADLFTSNCQGSEQLKFLVSVLIYFVQKALKLS